MLQTAGRHPLFMAEERSAVRTRGFSSRSRALRSKDRLTSDRQEGCVPALPLQLLLGFWVGKDSGWK